MYLFDTCFKSTKYFQLCSFYMQPVVETIGLINKQKFVLMDRT
jgi:hypothetical protein